MKSIGLLIACTTLFLAAAQAATISTTLNVTGATATISGTGVSVSGPATLTGGIGNGTFTASVSFSSTGGTDVSGTFKITLSTADSITGTVSLPAAILTGSTTSGSGSATVTGGSGTYSGATGSFSLSGSGAISGTGTITVSFSGPGTINTGGGGGSTGTPTPTITAVWDAASNTSNVAQGGIFIVKGSNLCPSGYKPFSVPRPTVSPDGVKITFTPAAGGAGTDAILVYTYNQSGVVQVAGILPSTVATGNYNVTVTNGIASAPFQTQVLQRKFALFTQDSSGSGLASVQNYISQSQVDLNSFTTGTGKATTISPAKPGQYLIAWGTGMGPLAGGDNSASPAYDFHANGVTVQAIVGGVTIPVLYAGRAGYAGEDQINFQLPANVPTGCTVTFQMSVNGQLSNPTFIAIAPDVNSTTCVQPGFTTNDLQQYDNGLSKTLSYFSLTQFAESFPQIGNLKVDLASGAFTRYTGYQLAGLTQAQYLFTSSGSCIVSHVQNSNSSQGLYPTPPGGLDAGAVTLNGPSGSGITNQPFTEDPNTYQYSLNLGTEGLPISGGLNATLVAGQYALVGAGGNDVGKFNAQITLGTPLTLNGGGLPSTVNRSAGLTLGWTGGNASDLVEIIGSSRTATGTGTSAITDTWTFICTTTAGAQTFTVPSSILQQLPAIALSSTGAGGFLEFASSVNPTSFTAPLVAGGNINSGTFLSWLGYGALVSYQ